MCIQGYGGHFKMAAVTNYLFSRVNIHFDPQKIATKGILTDPGLDRRFLETYQKFTTIGPPESLVFFQYGR